MNARAVVSRPFSLQPYNARTEHTGFSPARQRFTRTILVTNHHPCVVRPTGFCHEVSGTPGIQILHIHRASSYGKRRTELLSSGANSNKAAPHTANTWLRVEYTSEYNLLTDSG